MATYDRQRCCGCGFYCRLRDNLVHSELVDALGVIARVVAVVLKRHAVGAPACLTDATSAPEIQVVVKARKAEKRLLRVFGHRSQLD